MKVFSNAYEKFVNGISNFVPTVEKLFKSVCDNLMFVVICLLVTAVLIAAAHFAQLAVAKKNRLNTSVKKNTTRRMCFIAILSAIASVLMLFEIPLFFLPSFYEIDLSELPVLIGAFAMGPAAGITIEFIKIVLNLLFNGTTTAFVGEAANFIIGCCFIVPAGIIYMLKKTKRNAVIGMCAGGLICVAAGSLLNAFVLLPTYASLFGMELSALIGLGTDKNSLISGMGTFIAFAVAPFNIIKCLAVSLITMPVYKPVSRVIKDDVTLYGSKPVSTEK